jgi:hypothetical protein
MSLEIFVSVAVAVWVAVTLVVVSLCRAAKAGDHAMDTVLADVIAAEDNAECTLSSSGDRPLRTLSLDAAAAILGVEPHTVLAWETRYGFPTSSPDEGRYNRGEVLALRDTLEDGVSIASAVSRARARTKRRRATSIEQAADRRDGGLAS